MKKSIVRWISAILISAAALTASASCGSDGQPDDADRNEAPEQLELSVYLDGYTKDYMNAILDQYVREYPNVTVSSRDLTALNIPDYRTKLANDLMAGEGPDIVLVSNTTNNTIQNLTKLLQNDIFMDIDTLSPDLSMCSRKVLSAGKYLGKQYMAPLNYSIGFMVSSAERIAEYGVEFGSDLESFAGSLAALYDDGKYAFLEPFTTEFLYRQNRLELIDHKSCGLRTGSDAEKLLQSLSEAYLKLFPGIFESGKSGEYDFKSKLKDYGGSVDRAYGSGDLVFYSAPAFMGYFENLSYMNPACAQILESGEAPVLNVIPTLDGSAPSPSVNYILLVNANAKDHDACRKLIESAVGIESQYLCGMPSGIPVNNELIGKMRSFYLDGESDGRYEFNDKCDFPEGFAELWFDTIEALEDGVYIDVMTSGRLFSIIREYSSNGGNIESAIETGSRNISLYLSE